MTKQDYLDELQKIDYEGGLLTYICGYGGRSDDPVLSAIYESLATSVDRHERSIKDYFHMRGIDYDAMKIRKD